VQNVNDSARRDEEPRVTELRGIVQDGAKLLEEQSELFRAELRQEVDEASRATVSASIGVGLAALAGLTGTHAVVHLLHRTTRLPLWGCYGVVSGALALAVAEALSQARRHAAGVATRFPHTAAAVRENATWLKRQTTAGRT
jgi:hypothetical protein